VRRTILTLIALASGLTSGRAQAGCSDGVRPGHPDPGTSSGEAPDRRWPRAYRPTYRPGVSAAWAIVPGVGHLTLCDPAGAAVTWGAVAGGLGVGTALFQTDAEPFFAPAYAAAQNAYLYSIYDAYRLSATLRGGRDDRQLVDGARVLDHWTAPFQPRNLSDPAIISSAAVGIGLGVIGITLTPSTNATPVWQRPTVPWNGDEVPTAGGVVLAEAYSTSLFLSVGPGEEGLFRGVFQPALVDWLGPGGGVTAGAALFGLAHYPNGQGQVDQSLIAVAVTGSLGSIAGAVAHHDRYALGRPIAMHFWYDLSLLTTYFLLRPAEMPWAIQISETF